MKKGEFGLFPAPPRGGVASTGAVALCLSKAHARNAEYRREAGEARLLNGPDPGNRVHRVPRFRVALGHALVAAGEVVAGCRPAFDRGPVR